MNNLSMLIQSLDSHFKCRLDKKFLKLNQSLYQDVDIEKSIKCVEEYASASACYELLQQIKKQNENTKEKNEN